MRVLSDVTQLGPISRLLSRAPELSTQAEAQAGLRDVLADPTLDLLLTSPDGTFLAADGQTVSLDEQLPGRAVTLVPHGGRTVGALIHDPSVLEEPTALGELTGVLGLAIERNRINDQLRRQRDLLSAIGDGTPALLCLVFADGRMTPEGTNRAARELVGATQEELAGKLFWDAVVVPEDQRDVEQVIHRVVGGQPQADRVSRWRTVAGQAAVAWTCEPLPDIASEPVFLISGVDVSVREHQAQELRDSRSRIVVTADNERRRLERNLHDGAQQRLVSLALSLRRAESNVTSAPDEAVSALRAASQDLAEAIAELRELARGLHPAILTDRGLGPALQALAERAAIPVTLRNDLPGRLPEPVEAAAYFVVAESLTNAVKHAHGSEVVVDVHVADGALNVTIADDGVGGVAPGEGTGLRGLTDRVEAIAGHLDVTSSERGTCVRAAIPVEGSPVSR